RGTHPARIRPVGLAMLLLVDEVAQLLLDNTLSAAEAASVLADIRPKLDDLWAAIRAGDPVKIQLGKSNDPDFRIEMSFLSRALPRALPRGQQATAPTTN